jgi:aspartate racemase
LVTAAQDVEKGGGDFVIICTNTMHKLADEVERHIRIPLLHIADATARRIKSEGLNKVGLLGTRFTMEEAFYKDRLIEMHGLEVVIPTEPEREAVHRVIYDELCLGETRQASKEQYVRIMEHLIEDGAEGIILGCTEISLLVDQEDSSVPLFDTTQIHAEAAVDHALGS